MELHDTKLYFDIEEYKYPIVYHQKYNVSVFGLEKLHLFDSKKWKNVRNGLKEHGFSDDEIVQPLEATKEDLLVVHTKEYLNTLKWSFRVALIAEVPLLTFLPNQLVQHYYLKPMRLQVGGSILAGKLALDRGWAINIGGGFHHCSKNRGGGFCPYADITLLLTFLMDRGLVRRAMIVDLDAHQGNGYERDFIDNLDVYIMDMYNREIYPRDKTAKSAIRRKVEVRCGIEDEEYLNKMKSNLRYAMDEFRADIVVYNAGTDILSTDPLGLMNISSEGIIQRDQFVFEMCRKHKIPIVMLTSGGYLRETARIISDSIINLNSLGLIEKDGCNDQ